ncbi:MAG TPA: hypothetical protein VHB68_06805 [Steroidobacteraceae bacterium]|nr:hypothetical protein [Steroidobacteraceae bacterium]
MASSRDARTLFLCTALLTAAILWWIKDFAATHGAARLSPIFVSLFTVLDYPAAVCTLLIAVAAALVPGKYTFRPLLGWIEDHTWPIAGVVCVVMCIGTLQVYLNHPLTQDEFAPYFQSQVFAAGHLTGRFPPRLVDWLVLPTYQDHFFFVSHSSGRIVSAYWPAFALLLTPFTFLGIPWACNPVISALTLPVIRRLALRIFADRETAGLAVLLTLASPVFWADGISYYSMSAHLLANCVFALLLLDPTARRALATGFVGSIALTLHNPVPHLLFAVPWILAVARRQDGAKLTGCLFAGYLPLSFLLGLAWAAFSGSLVHAGGASAVQAASSDGVLSRVTSVFSLPDSSILLARWVGIVKVWVWAVPGMVLLALAGAWRWRRNPHCRLFVISALTTLLGYVLVPVDQGHGWGYRYFHSAWMVLPLLAAGALAPAAVGVQRNATTARAFFDRLPEDSAVRAYMVACALLTLTLGCGLRAIQIRDFMSGQINPVPAYAGTERRVVIMSPAVGLDLTRDDPWLRGNAIYLFSRGEVADATMMRESFPGLRPVFADSRGSVWSAAPAPGSHGPGSRGGSR